MALYSRQWTVAWGSPNYGTKLELDTNNVVATLGELTYYTQLTDTAIHGLDHRVSEIMECLTHNGMLDEYRKLKTVTDKLTSSAASVDPAKPIR